MSRPVLHDYWRSSAAYRVRIALNMKGVDYDSRPVDLVSSAQRSADYLQLNPQGLVPTLEIDGQRLTQSIAIIAYLEATRREPPLLPADPAEQARVRTLALTIACDIHPLNNLRVLRYLKQELGQDQEAVDTWYRHWITEGLSALESLAAGSAGDFLVGDQPTLADICLVPQLYNARRFDVPLGAWPTLLRADENANRLEPFARAHPDRQEKPQ